MSTQIIKIDALQKYYGAKFILDDIKLNLNRGERAALVGENGVGKSTLARLVLGLESPDHGVIDIAQGVAVAYLPQELQVADDIAVMEYIESGVGEINSLRRDMARLEAKMENGQDLDALLLEYGCVQELFEQRGGYTLEARLGRIIVGLQIDHVSQLRKVMSLSGGEKTSVGLAALLLQEPDLLNLDETTNHLDRRGLIWLEEYLLGYPNALLMITHDRHSINRLATKIIDLSAVTHSLTTYHGNYDDYLAQRKARYDQEVGAYHAQVNQLKALQVQIKETHGHRKASKPSDGDKNIRWHGAQMAERSASRSARSARQQLNDLEANKRNNPRHIWQIRYDFDPQPLTSMEPLHLQNLSFSYGQDPLIKSAEAVLNKGDRVALVAENGEGKTTLLRLIMRELEPNGGEPGVMPGAELGYLDQTGNSFNEGQNILDVLRVIRGDSDDYLLTLLHRCGVFRDAHLARRSIAELSLGQRRNLGLACLIQQCANVLILDEPTNHLDLPSLEALEDALMRFPGAILAATHDRYFIDKVATAVWHLHEGNLIVE